MIDIIVRREDVYIKTRYYYTCPECKSEMIIDEKDIKYVEDEYDSKSDYYEFVCPVCNHSNTGGYKASVLSGKGFRQVECVERIKNNTIPIRSM